MRTVIKKSDKKEKLKCNMDCLNCTLPVRKCHGGTYKAATDWTGANKQQSGRGKEAPRCAKINHRVFRGSKMERGN